MAVELDTIRERALRLPHRIVLVDGEDGRVVEAVACVAAEGSIRPVLLGNEEVIRGLLRPLNQSSGIEIIDPEQSPLIDEFASVYRMKRENRGKPVSKEVALGRVTDPSYFAALLLETSRVDGAVGGAALPTADILRAALETVGLSDKTGIVSGAFAMFLPIALPSGQNVLLFTDCAVVPDPDSEQLAAIGTNAVRIMRKVIGTEPVVAFLSFSTKGSASHLMVDKVVKAKEDLEKRLPDVKIDGELQVDTALIPEVAERKAPGGGVGGQANILIFPDLNSGNIAYKLVERLARAEALGVILEGFNKPVNDLSRGCSTRGVIDMICVTALQVAHDPSVHNVSAANYPEGNNERIS